MLSQEYDLWIASFYEGLLHLWGDEICTVVYCWSVVMLKLHLKHQFAVSRCFCCCVQCINTGLYHSLHHYVLIRSKTSFCPHPYLVTLFTTKSFMACARYPDKRKYVSRKVWCDGTYTKVKQVPNLTIITRSWQTKCIVTDVCGGIFLQTFLNDIWSARWYAHCGGDVCFSVRVLQK